MISRYIFLPTHANCKKMSRQFENSVFASWATRVYTLILSYFLFSKAGAVRQECIAATARSYRNKADPSHLASFHRDHMYSMITDCFHDHTNLTLVAKCQSPDTNTLSDNVPVTSQLTGYTYWNVPCAVCNDDADDVLEWTTTVIMKSIIPYFSNSSMNGMYPDTFEKLVIF